MRLVLKWLLSAVALLAVAYLYGGVQVASFGSALIAAAVIGGTSLSGGIGRITGTVIGTVILGVITSGFTFIGFDAYIQDMVKGAVIVAAVVVDRYRHREGLV